MSERSTSPEPISAGDSSSPWQRRAVEGIAAFVHAEAPGLAADDAEAFARYLVLGDPRGARSDG